MIDKAKNYIILLLLLVAFSSSAQITNSQLIQSIKDWERAKEYTREYLIVVSEDGLFFRPTAEMRTFAEQLLHLAEDNYFFTSMALGKLSPYKFQELEKNKNFKTKDDIIKVVMDSYDHVINALKDLGSDDKFTEVIKLKDFESTRQTIINKGFEHQTHHRGQTTVYLRLKGIKPPDEKLF